jgi:hypothetical protein
MQFQIVVTFISKKKNEMNDNTMEPQDLLEKMEGTKMKCAITSSPLLLKSDEKVAQDLLEVMTAQKMRCAITGWPLLLKSDEKVAQDI